MGFQGAWTPVVMKNYREKGAPEKFMVVFNYYLFLVLSILIGLSIFGREILLLLTTQTFSEGFVVVPLLVLGAILASIGQYFTYGIQIALKSHYTLYLNLSALVINVILNFVLIPRLGIVGAALATVLSFTFLSIAAMAISQRLYYVPYNWRNIITAGLISVAVSNLLLVVNIDVSIEAVVIKVIITLLSIYALSRVFRIPLNQQTVRMIKDQIWSRQQ
jgi:O-antigen/teichoic acid export membrane protein